MAMETYNFLDHQEPRPLSHASTHVAVNKLVPTRPLARKGINTCVHDADSAPASWGPVFSQLSASGGFRGR